MKGEFVNRLLLYSSSTFIMRYRVIYVYTVPMDSIQHRNSLFQRRRYRGYLQRHWLQSSAQNQSPALGQGQRKLDSLNAATSLNDLRSPGNQLEKLTGKLEGFWSIRVSDQYRICFRFDSRNATEVLRGHSLMLPTNRVSSHPGPGPVGGLHISKRTHTSCAFPQTANS